ncbi:MAG TPA: aromatic ring-hydroxylating dioxygenase subunit alpha [Chthoniobacterales bacterium]|jgi:methanesulfonate monooxygenase subunit alpha|nr:aromatic ring-hydroxylating dioxygenase subunit alpha [Chthoniobacterales bacterium]
MARTSEQWADLPKLPPTHFVNSRIYTDEEIHREEIEKIFNKVWLIACHESELPNKFDFRTFQHPCGRNLVIIRGEDDKVRAFYNTCSHRANTIVQEPAGNAKRLTCIFHHWTYDAHGNCIDIPRETQGYDGRICKANVGLREVKCEMGLGGFIWVNIDDACEPLSAFLGNALEDLQTELSAAPLEIFHYHQAIVETNYKLWHDTNRELYHDYMHYHNRLTGLSQKGYFDRVYHTYPNGHVQLDSMEIQYQAYRGKQRTLGWPGAAAASHKLIDIFPGTTFILRTPSMRVDTMTPLGANRVLIEFRGFGLKTDTPEERAERLKEHNNLWGPFGLNLHEDLHANEMQTQAMRDGVEPAFILHAREENNTTHDEIGMRQYYAEWGRRMGRSPHDPYGKPIAAAA